jgi:hypothetical protein
MVLAISFLEAPHKFRAPGITLSLGLGLGIGRLVFHALNAAEILLAALLTIACTTVRPDAAAWALLAVSWLVLTTQIGILRPRLDGRAQQIIAGRTPAPS